MIDVIIVNYNSTAYLVGCLKSVKQSLNGMEAHIFVQDNASSDGIEKIRKEYPDVFLTRNRSNIGFAAAVNQALAIGDSPYVVLLNPDAVVLDDFFRVSVDFMKSNPQAGILGPKVLERDGLLQNSARSFPTFLTALFGRTSFLTRLFPENRFTRKNLLSMVSDGSSPMEVDWVSGACMVVKREAIEKVGGLDDRFFLYWEDADWCARMWESGWKVIYYPRAAVRHFTGASSRKRYLRSVFEFHKSAYRLYEKKRSANRLFLRPFILLGLFVHSGLVLGSHGVRGIYEMISGKPKRKTRTMN